MDTLYERALDKDPIEGQEVGALCLKKRESNGRDVVLEKGTLVGLKRNDNFKLL